MSLEKVAVKNERPGIMMVPGLRPPEENPDAPDPTDVRAADEHEERALTKA